MTEQTPAQQRVGRGVQRAGLVSGPLVALVLYAALPVSYETTTGLVALDHAARATIGVAAWMALWWMTEALPVAATALLPLVVFPLLGIATAEQAAAPYGHHLIFLFLGGFMIALAMERWGLHRRVAVHALRWVGSRPTHLVAGFMMVSALLSMWVSNTATAVMMLPVASSLADGDQNDSEFIVCLLLGVAYGCSIGGIATPIGTPPNVFLLSFLSEESGIEISFLRWMGFGVPLAAVFLPLAWWVLTRMVFTIGTEPLAAAAELQRQGERLGLMGPGERSASAAFGLAAALWVVRPLINSLEVAGVRPFAELGDSSIAVGAALLLFLLPGGDTDPSDGPRPRALDWATAARLPWGILILFGGGLSLAAAIRSTGVDAFLGHQVAALEGLPAPLVVAGVVALLVFVTELTSNTATTATFVPLLAAIAPGLGMPSMLLIVPAAVAASFAFMLPVATPPNAVVFASGRVTVSDMSRAGLRLNLAAIVMIPLLTFAIAVPWFGIEP